MCIYLYIYCGVLPETVPARVMDNLKSDDPAPSIPLSQRPGVGGGPGDNGRVASAKAAASSVIVRDATTIYGIRLGADAHRAVADPTLGAVTYGWPLVVPPAVPVAPHGLAGQDVTELTHAALRAGGVPVSYFVFDPARAYTIDIGPLGMVIDAVVRGRVELQKRGQAPYGGQVQYGRLHRRLHVHCSPPGRLRTTFFVRGDGEEFPTEGCWSGDFGPQHSYTAYVHQLGMLVLDSTATRASVPDPRFGDLLGVLDVGCPRDGHRVTTYLCY